MLPFAQPRNQQPGRQYWRWVLMVIWLPWWWVIRVTWLPSTLLGANQGLVFVAAMIIGTRAVTDDAEFIIQTALAGMLGGAFSVAIGRIISVYDGRRERRVVVDATVSTMMYLLGGAVPLLAAAFIKRYEVRLVVGMAATLALMLLGAVVAKLAKAPIGKTCFMMIGGAWLAMLANFGSMKLFGSDVQK